VRKKPPNPGGFSIAFSRPKGEENRCKNKENWIVKGMFLAMDVIKARVSSL
jgi:hypothetical protein